MTRKLDKLLCNRYPKIFAQRNADMRTTCMCWGFECGDGWFWLIDQLCRALQSRIDNTHPQPPQVVAIQVKEKYGGLRFYVAGGDSVSQGMIDLAERMSQYICESCGTTVNVGTTQGWAYTRCSRCATAEGVVDNWKSYEEWERLGAKRRAAEKRLREKSTKRAKKG